MQLKAKTYLFVVAVLVMTFFVYFFENEVNELDSQIAEKSQLLAKYKRDIKVLQAEWSYQNNPERLIKLAKKTRKKETLKPPRKIQFTNISNLPNREVRFTETNMEKRYR